MERKVRGKREEERESLEVYLLQSP